MGVLSVCSQLFKKEYRQMPLQKTVKVDETTFELLQAYKAFTELPITAIVRKAVREHLDKNKFVFVKPTNSKRK
jgi:hypothetical protein